MVVWVVGNEMKENVSFTTSPYAPLEVWSSIFISCTPSFHGGTPFRKDNIDELEREDCSSARHWLDDS